VTGTAETGTPTPATTAGSVAKITAPTSVLGLQARELEEFLGAPKLVRHDAPAEVWQYRSAACVLDVFLYQDKPTAGIRVKYAEARTIAAEPAQTDECVNAIRQQNSSERVPT
jgi:hypothetical protein